MPRSRWPWMRRTRRCTSFPKGLKMTRTAAGWIPFRS